MTYDDFSYFAQTWGLGYLFLLFVLVLIYALRPSSKKKFEQAANIPLKED
jgi:cytochrome c oxidase cbb3-type subunit IV